MTRVPVELSDCVIDFLHDDPTALKACALCCRAWVPASRFHLFRSIALPSRSSTSPFQQLLHSTPDLGWYVRELTVAKFVDPKDVFTPPPRSGAPAAEACLPQIFIRLPNLRALTLSHMDMKSMSARDLRGLAHAAVTSLSLAYCQFAEFADVVDLVAAFPALVELSMTGLTWKDETRAAAAPACPLATLRTLSLGREMDSEKVLAWLEAAEVHTSITSLAMRCGSERDADLFGPFLRLAGASSLRELDLDWSVQGDKTIALPQSLSLGECTALDNLTLRFPVNYSTSLPWVTSLLGTLESPSVRSISCDVRLLGNIDGLEWDGLSTVLCSEAYRSMQALKFTISLWPGAHKDLAEVEELIRTRLAPLHKKGIIHVSKA